MFDRIGLVADLSVALSGTRYGLGCGTHGYIPGIHCGIQSLDRGGFRVFG